MIDLKWQLPINDVFLFLSKQSYINHTFWTLYPIYGKLYLVRIVPLRINFDGLNNVYLQLCETKSTLNLFSTCSKKKSISTAKLCSFRQWLHILTYIKFWTVYTTNIIISVTSRLSHVNLSGSYLTATVVEFLHSFNILVLYVIHIFVCDDLKSIWIEIICLCWNKYANIL